MLGDPSIEVEQLDVGECGVGIGTAKEQQSFDDLPELESARQGRLQDAAIFVWRAILSQRDLELPGEDCKWCAQLVGRVVAESALAMIGDLQSCEQVIKRTAQFVQFIAGSGFLQVPAGVEGIEPARGSDHPRKRGQHAPGEPAAKYCSEQPSTDAHGDEESSQVGKG